MSSKLIEILERNKEVSPKSNVLSKLDKTETIKNNAIEEKVSFDETIKKPSGENNFESAQLSFKTQDNYLESISIGEGTLLRGWKLMSNLSARVIDYDEDSVILECLTDKEHKTYEENEFKRSYFEGYNIELGKVFKLCWYERKNQVMMEIKDNPKLIMEDDFPKISLTNKYKNLKVRK